MSDSASSLPIRTEAAGDVAVKIVDGTVTSQSLNIDATGRVTVKLDDGAGNVITSQASGAQRAVDVGINVAGVQVDPRAVRALTSADVVTANQGSANTAANGWTVKPTDGTNSQAYLATGEAKVSVTQPLPAGTNSVGKVAQDNTTQWVTSDLANGSVTGGTAGSKSMLSGAVYTAALPTLTTGQQVGLQADVNGRLLVNIAADGIVLTTSDAADGPVAPGTVATKSILTGVQYNSSLPTFTTGQQGAIQADSSGRILVSSIANSLPAGTNNIGKISVQDSSGAAITALNPLPVQIAAGTPGTEVHNFSTAAAVAKGATSNHDYTITATKTFKAEKFWASASGKMKIEVQVSTNGTVFTTKFVGFNSTATPNIDIYLGQFTLTDVGTGSIVRIIRTNLDNAQDLYSTVSGIEL